MLVFRESAIESGYDFYRFLVSDWPEGHEQVIDSRQKKAASQTENAFALERFARCGITGRKRCQPGVLQVNL